MKCKKRKSKIDRGTDGGWDEHEGDGEKKK